MGNNGPDTLEEYTRFLLPKRPFMINYEIV